MRELSSNNCIVLEWKYPNDYEYVTILLSGFHQLRVLQRIVYKRHTCKEYQSWWTENAFSGGHYYLNMWLHKESFNALVQFRIENIASGYTDMDLESITITAKKYQGLKYFCDSRQGSTTIVVQVSTRLKGVAATAISSAKTANEVIACSAFELLVEKILKTSVGEG